MNSETGDRPLTAAASGKAVDRLAAWVREQTAQIRSGAVLARMISGKADQAVARHWAEGVSGVGVFALGGSGRQEMSPRSDIDLMFFYQGRSRSGVREACLKTVYGLWDDGFDVGYSIRNAREAREEVLADTRTRNALLDARFLFGDTTVARSFDRDVLPTVLGHRRKSYISTILAERDSRRRQFGKSPYLLEPNVKETAGGLRDIQTALWISRVAFGTDGFRGLDRILERRDVFDLYAALDFLWRVRIQLHLNTGRKYEILDFAQQERVSRSLGYGPKRGRSADERLMARYFLRIRSGEAACRRLIEHALVSVIGKRGGPSRLFFRRLPPPFRISKGYLIVEPGADRAADPAFILTALELSARYGAPLSPVLVSAVRSRLRELGAIRRDAGAGEAFLNILKGPRVAETLARMHGLGVLGRYIPEFGHIQCLVVKDPFHRYTVDEHSLHVVEHLEKLGDAAAPKSQPLADAYEALKGERHLLYLAGLLHDTAKGGRSPHLGKHRSTDLMPVLERFPLSQDEREFVRFLGLHHQLLSHAAEKREIEDPAVAEDIAAFIRDPQRLRALYLLTYADQSAVRPGFWSRWRSHLITEIYLRVLRVLREEAFGGEDREAESTGIAELVGNFSERYRRNTDRETLVEDAALFAAASRDEPAIRIRPVAGEALELAVCGPARAGLFPTIAGLLAVRRMNIVRAQVFSGKDRRELLRFIVSDWDETASAVSAEAIRAELLTLLRTGRALQPPERSIIPPGHKTEILASNEDVPGMTTLEILCADRVGLLYDIATAVERAGGRVASARISTDGTTACDVLYLDQLPPSCLMDLLAALTALLFPTD